jgi:alkaline phosphatase
MHPQFKHPYLFDGQGWSTFSANRFCSRQNKNWMGRITETLKEHLLIHNWMKNVKSNIFSTEMVYYTCQKVLLKKCKTVL